MPFRLSLRIAILLTVLAGAGLRPVSEGRAAPQATATTLLLGTADSGVYRSDDAGASWQPVNAGLPPGGVW